MDWLLAPTTAIEKIGLAVFAIVLFLAVMGLIVNLVDRPKIKPGLVAAGFLGPVVLIVGFGLVYPAIRTIIQSFQVRTRVVGADGKPVRDASNKILTENSFTFDNYQTVATDDGMQRVLLNTAAWVILVPLLSTLIGLIYAVIIDRSRFEKFAKALIFLPMAISMVGASIIWGFIYDYKGAPGAEQIGLANQFLVWLGLEPMDFLRNWPMNTIALMVVMIWIQAGFAMTILSAAIKAIPDDVVEAARIDGATGMKLFANVTVPSIRPALVVVLTAIAMTSLKSFDIVRTMGRNNEAVSVVANEFYTQQFTRNQPGIAAALAVLLFVLVIPIILYNVRQMKQSEAIR